MRPLLARCHHRNVGSAFDSAFDTGADLGRHGRVGLSGTLRPCHGGAAGEGAHGMSGTFGGGSPAIGISPGWGFKPSKQHRKLSNC